MRTRSPSPKWAKKRRRRDSYSPEPKKIKSVVGQVYKHTRNDKTEETNKHSYKTNEYESKRDKSERHVTSYHRDYYSPTRSTSTDIRFETRRSPKRRRSKSPIQRSTHSSPGKHYESRRRTSPFYDRDYQSSTSYSQKRIATSTSTRRYSESPQSDRVNYHRSLSPQSERCGISSTSNYRSSTPESSSAFMDIRRVQYEQASYPRKVQKDLMYSYDFLDDIKITYRLLNTKPCLSDHICKEQRYLFNNTKQPLYMNIPEILQRKMGFDRIVQLNQLSDENKVLFFRYMMQIITLALVTKKYVNYSESINLGNALPDFAGMLNVQPMEFQLLVKQLYSFAQLNNTIELPPHQGKLTGYPYYPKNHSNYFNNRQCYDQSGNQRFNYKRPFRGRSNRRSNYNFRHRGRGQNHYGDQQPYEQYDRDNQFYYAAQYQNFHQYYDRPPQSSNQQVEQTQQSQRSDQQAIPAYVTSKSYTQVEESNANEQLPVSSTWTYPNATESEQDKYPSYYDSYKTSTSSTNL